MQFNILLSKVLIILLIIQMSSISESIGNRMLLLDKVITTSVPHPEMLKIIILQVEPT